jgi:hypothetical protein
VVDILPNEWKLKDPWASEKSNLIEILTHLSSVARWAIISFPLLRVSTVLITVIALSHDYLYRNDSVSDITRNLRNFRPTVHSSFANNGYVITSYGSSAPGP